MKQYLLKRLRKSGTYSRLLRKHKKPLVCDNRQNESESCNIIPEIHELASTSATEFDQFVPMDEQSHHIQNGAEDLGSYFW